jgi:SAM-dependent methyltransferase
VSPKTLWYETFFEGLVLDLWRGVMSPEQTQTECAFLEEELRLPPGARVLDVPCGDGRHAAELAARGYRLTGVDISEGQIAAARRRPAPDGPPVTWIRAEMRNLPDDRFDAAYCFGNSLGYMDPAGTRTFLSAVSRRLEPGARFALDTGMLAECRLPRFQEHESAQVGDILFVEDNRYDADAGCIETVYTLSRGDETVTRTGLQWVFTLREIREMFRDAGLEPVATYASLDRAPFALGAPAALLVGEKLKTQDSRLKAQGPST